MLRAPSLWLGLLLCWTATTAQAACTRADVDHFLSRGFTQEQVVMLCGGDVRENAEPVASERTEVERQLRDLLLQSVAARNLDLTADRLRWTDSVCLEYAPPNLAGQPRKRCGQVEREIARAEFDVQGTRSKVLFFGEQGVQIAGQIAQRWDISLDRLSAADAERMRAQMQAQTEQTLLPLHATADPAEVAAALRRWKAVP